MHAQVADDAGWYKRYEDKWQSDRTSLKECNYGSSPYYPTTCSTCVWMTLAERASSTAPITLSAQSFPASYPPWTTRNLLS